MTRPAKVYPPCLRCDSDMYGHHQDPVPGQKRYGRRGLCKGCATRIERRHGNLHLYPRRTSQADVVLEDAMIYARRGMTRHEVAEKLGYTSTDSLYQVFRRAGKLDLYDRFKMITEGVAA